MFGMFFRPYNDAALLTENWKLSHKINVSILKKYQKLLDFFIAATLLKNQI
jgi:hypothetical protein